MHRNTYLLVIFLALFAALVIGVNIGRRLTGTVTTPAVSPTPAASPAPEMTEYTNPLCGFTVSYPNTLTMMGSSTGSAILTNANDATQSVAIACQNDIPRPALDPTRTEKIQISNPGGSTISATLYHDTSAKDGTPIDKLMFRSPKNGADVFIAGSGDTFSEVIKSLRLLP